MFLLSDFGDFANWFIAALTLASIIISLYSLLTTKKITELTDIVVELKNQNQELSNQTRELGNQYEELLFQSEIQYSLYKMEHEARIKDRIPYFVRHNFEVVGDRAILKLKNEGKDAHEVECKIEEKYKHLTIYTVSSTQIPHSQLFGIDIHAENPIEKNEFNFEFILSYYDDNTIRLFQKITIDKGILYTQSPQGVMPTDYGLLLMNQRRSDKIQNKKL